MYQYKTKGTCSQMIYFDLEDNKVKNVQFMGGCNGNLKGIAALVEGMDMEDAIVRLEGITVTEEEVQAKYEELVNMYGMSLQQIQAQLPPSRLIHDIKLLRARAVVVDSAKRV